VTASAVTTRLYRRTPPAYGARMPGRAATFVVAALATAACGQSADAGPMRKGPYLQDLEPDAVTVMWQLADPQPSALIVDADGSAAPRRLAVPAMPVAAIRVDGLSPHTHYRYRVEAAGQSWPGELTTAAAPGDDVPLTIIALGDSRDGPSTHRRLLARAALDHPDIILGNGDIVADGSRETDWQDFFLSAGDVLRDVVYYPTLGNHERHVGAPAPAGYREYFAVPGSPAGETADYYVCSYGTTRIVMLDSTAGRAEIEAETAWLDRELAAARRDPAIRHVIVAMHYAMFSVGHHGGTAWLRDRWTPLFERAGVTMVISGHDHAYERAEHGGVHYFVSGGGGAPLYDRASAPAAADADAVITYEATWHYLRVKLAGDHVEVAGVRADGTVIETTSWSDAPEARERAAVVDRAAEQVRGPASSAPPPAEADAEVDDREDDSTWMWLLAAAMVPMLGAIALIYARR
jgi:acid phosphatase type 7